MADRTVKVNITAETSAAVKSFQNLATTTDDTSSKMQSSWGKLSGNIKSAGSKIAGAFGPASNLLQNLPMFQGPIGEMFSGMSESSQGLKEKFTELGEEGNSAFKKVGSGMAAAGLGLAGLGAGLDELSSPLEASENQLKTAISDAGGSFDDLEPKIKSADAAMQNLGIRNQDTNTALATLTSGLHNPQEALQDLGEAANIAAAKHESLNTAAASVMKLYAGSTKVLKTFGIASGDVATTTAQVSAADNKVTTAKRTLMDVEEEDAGKKTLSIGQQIQLKNVTDSYNDAVKNQKQVHEDALSPQDAFTANMAQLAAVTKGQANAAIDTFGGHLDVIKDKVLDGASQLGQKYGPALMGVGAGMTIVGGLVDGASSALKLFTTGSEAASAATDVLGVSDDALAVSETAADTAGAPLLLTFGLIAAAVVGLGVVAFELVDHWSTVWGAISGAAEDAWNFIDSNVFQPIANFFTQTVPGIADGVIDWFKNNWPLLLGILTGPIGLAVLAIATHWDTIKTDVSNLIGDITSFFTGLPGKVVSALGDFASKVWTVLEIGDDWLNTHIGQPIDNFFTGIPSKIVTAAVGMWDGVGTAFKSTINDIIDIWNNLVSHFDIPAIGIGPFHTPEIDLGSHLKIPHLAAGGIVPATSGGVLALLGEGGQDEAIVPLGRHGGGGAAGGVTNIVYNVVANGADGDSIVNALKTYQQRNGGLPFRLAS